MKLYLLQEVFTFGERFTVYDENETACFYIEGEVFSFGKKLHLYNAREQEIALIHQEVFSFPPTYHVMRGGKDVASIVKEVSFFHQSYSVEGPNWQVEGDFSNHEYTITKDGRLVATVSREWFSLGDSYVIDVVEGNDGVIVLATALVIDTILSD